MGKKLNSGTTAVHPIIGGIAPAAPPITMFNEVVLFKPKCINKYIKNIVKSK